MRYPHTTLIVNQFPALKRKPLLRWLMESSFNGKSHHSAFLASLENVSGRAEETLELQDKILFMLLHEFNTRLSPRAVQLTIDTITEKRNAQHLN